MTLFNRIHRRLKINRTVRELSRLDRALLNDIGLDYSNLSETVEKMVDASTSVYEVKHQPAFNTIPVANGAPA